MKTIDNTMYFSKKEIAERIGCSLATINNRICATGVQGYNFGRVKYYTEPQIKILAEFQKQR